MFDSPPSPSWSSTFLPSTTKGGGWRARRGGGWRQMLQNGRARPPGARSGTVRPFRSVSSPELLGRRLVNVVPAVMASR
ncbi:hypothetical protein PBY51_016882 [Eleginops maclovinus]|uniref:Uncharacterized protein n=1 Tax=Eleginops maclovinus TaxID=56733 RepID=A0AAN7WSD4_ELEMC|nr:hypothetical protein PBY51_016882 [Eleginops maclovinus]